MSLKSVATEVEHPEGGLGAQALNHQQERRVLWATLQGSTPLGQMWCRGQGRASVCVLVTQPHLCLRAPGCVALAAAPLGIPFTF